MLSNHVFCSGKSGFVAVEERERNGPARHCSFSTWTVVGNRFTHSSCRRVRRSLSFGTGRPVKTREPKLDRNKNKRKSAGVILGKETCGSGAQHGGVNGKFSRIDYKLFLFQTKCSRDATGASSRAGMFAHKHVPNARLLSPAEFSRFVRCMVLHCHVLPAPLGRARTCAALNT